MEVSKGTVVLGSACAGHLLMSVWLKVGFMVGSTCATVLLNTMRSLKALQWATPIVCAPESVIAYKKLKIEMKHLRIWFLIDAIILDILPHDSFTLLETL